VMQSADGGIEQVMLYGFVATAFGKTDAESKARKFLKKPDVNVVNRIEIRPEIQKLKPKAPAGQQDETGPSEETPEEKEAESEYLNQGSSYGANRRNSNPNSGTPDPLDEILRSFVFGFRFP